MKFFIQCMNYILQRNKVILISNNVLDFIDYKLELDSYRGININIYVFINFIKFILKVNIVRGKNMSIEVEKIKVLLILILLDRGVCVFVKCLLNYKKGGEIFF